MATTFEDGERIRLSLMEVRILSCLLMGQMTGYEIARQCEADEADPGWRVKVSSGTIYPALRRLVTHNFVEVIASNPIKQTSRLSNLYRVTSTGNLVLGWEVDRLEKITSLAQDRLKNV